MALLQWRAFTLAGSRIFKYIGNTAALIPTVVEACFGPPWPPTTGYQHSRAHLRYGSGLTDVEEAIIAPLQPPPKSTADHGDQ
jgi:hypothetical protein